MGSPNMRKLAPRGRKFLPTPERLEARECRSGGLVDPTFHGGSPETTAVMDLANATAVQPDGKTVVVGRLETGAFGLSPKLAVARFNVDGTPDSTFGSGGVAYAAVAGTSGNGVALQPDGKILVCGIAPVKAKGATSNAFLVARYLPNGALDATFAQGGTFTWDYGAGDDGATRMALLPDGSLLVAGGANGGLAGGSSLAVFKLSPAGAIVKSFGTNGVLLVNPGNSGSGASSMALAPNGDAILAGMTHLGTPGGQADAGLLVAVTPAGKLDTSFHSTGYLATLGPSYGSLAFNDVAIQAGAIIVVGGPTADPPAGGMGGLIARYNLFGALDATFGAGGYFTTSDAARFNGLALEPDGSIVAGGLHNDVGDDGLTSNEMAIAHLTADGMLDAAFGTLGTGFVYAQAGVQSEVRCLVVASDGRITAAGYGYSTRRTASLIRLTAP